LRDAVARIVLRIAARPSVDEKLVESSSCPSGGGVANVSTIDGVMMLSDENTSPLRVCLGVGVVDVVAGHLG